MDHNPDELRRQAVVVCSILQRMRPGAGLVHDRNKHQANLDMAIERFDDARARLNPVAQATDATSLEMVATMAIGWLVMHGYGSEVGRVFETGGDTVPEEVYGE